MKQLKEIFGRKTSIWLALELVLVTFACWWAFDPIIVTSYVNNLPLGYDTDRLVRFEVASKLSHNGRYEQLRAVENEEESLLQKIQQMDGVEMAYPAVNSPIGCGIYNMSYYLFNGDDSIQAEHYGFTKDDKMFEVYGIESLTPEVPTSELTHDCDWERTIILTRSLAMTLFGTIDVAGRTVKAKFYGYDEEKGDFGWLTTNMPIRAVVEDVRSSRYQRDYTILFVCQSGPSFNVPIIARLRDGVDAQRFIEEHQHEMLHDLVTDRCYVRQMRTLSEISNKETEKYAVSRQARRNLFIAAFFAINLAFGVFGTLLMYTRQRREEAGVRRAFGATRWSVFWNFISEAWLLTTISVVAGCAIYFQFATTHGLFSHFLGTNGASHYWFDDFGTHFLVVSVIVYLVLLCAVLIATAIPAWRICRSEITVALKDE